MLVAPNSREAKYSSEKHVGVPYDLEGLMGLRGGVGGNGPKDVGSAPLSIVLNVALLP